MLLNDLPINVHLLKNLFNGLIIQLGIGSIWIMIGGLTLLGSHHVRNAYDDLERK